MECIESAISGVDEMIIDQSWFLGTKAPCITTILNWNTWEAFGQWQRGSILPIMAIVYPMYKVSQIIRGLGNALSNSVELRTAPSKKIIFSRSFGIVRVDNKWKKQKNGFEYRNLLVFASVMLLISNIRSDFFD